MSRAPQTSCRRARTDVEIADFYICPQLEDERSPGKFKSVDISRIYYHGGSSWRTSRPLIAF